jgi:hypothetical protein
MDYLWIDSICIVQDSQADWRQESEKMGMVYENAFLIIVAARAKNSTEGLFSTLRFPELSIEVPFCPSGENPSGTFNVTMFHHLEDRPDFGPLRIRGWTHQEWHLARRIIFFMGGGMIWMCKESEHNEMGIDREIRSWVTLFGRASTGEWLHFLGCYSFSLLSFQKDRLPAIAGIANEIGKKRRDKYHLGVWENDIEKLLIWRPQSLKYHPGNERKDQRDLPSWC